MTESGGPDGEGPTADTPGSVRADFDWSEVPPSTAVVETVAKAAERDPLELEPLFETIDPDALDMLIRSMGTNSADGDATVTFTLDGYQVTVQRGGTVVVRPDTARSGSE